MIPAQFESSRRDPASGSGWPGGTTRHVMGQRPGRRRRDGRAAPRPTGTGKEELGRERAGSASQRHTPALELPASESWARITGMICQCRRSSGLGPAGPGGWPGSPGPGPNPRVTSHWRLGVIGTRRAGPQPWPGPGRRRACAAFPWRCLPLPSCSLRVTLKQQAVSCLPGRAEGHTSRPVVCLGLRLAAGLGGGRAAHDRLPEP
jgi:hypothetical protein